MSSVLRNETPTVFRKRSFSTGKKKKLCWCPNLKKMEKNGTFGLGRRGRFITVRPVAWHERPIHSLGPGNNPSAEMGDSVLWRSMAHSDYRDVGVWATPNRNNSGKPESETTIPGSRASSVLSIRDHPIKIRHGKILISNSAFDGLFYTILHLTEPAGKRP
jgi:hypothetical protein